jgi:hypothetical protein
MDPHVSLQVLQSFESPLALMMGAYMLLVVAAIRRS